MSLVELLQCVNSVCSEHVSLIVVSKTEVTVLCMQHFIILAVC